MSHYLYSSGGVSFQFNHFLNLIESIFNFLTTTTLHINRASGPSRSTALLNWTHQFIIDDLHYRGSATFQVKPNQSRFFHQPECSILGIATHTPLLAGLVGNFYVSRCPSLTVVTPKLFLVCIPPYYHSHHSSCSGDSRSLLEPLQG